MTALLVCGYVCDAFKGMCHGPPPSTAGGSGVHGAGGGGGEPALRPRERAQTHCLNHEPVDLGSCHGDLGRAGFFC